MKDADKAKLREHLNELDGLKSRGPEQKKFKDWKEKTEKKLEEVFGKNSDPVNRLRRVRFFDFGRQGKTPDTPLSENERKEYLQGLDQAKRVLRHFV